MNQPRKKVFCVGANKTGTTSMELLFKQLGLAVAPQGPAEMLLEDWGRRDFRALIEFCAGFEAFQDIPFSLPFTFQAMDQAFPGSKFILTVRNNAREWYESAVRFESMELGRLPRAEDLKENPYRYKGWCWRAHELPMAIDESTLHDADIYQRHYNRHIDSIVDYFSQRPDDLLVLNLAEPNGVERVCDFLGLPRQQVPMPHLNRSR